MRAQFLRSFGEDARFEAALVDDPVPGAGEVLIEIAATSINPIECKLRRFGTDVAPALPAILGSDIAGHVVRLGPGVDRLAVGDAVFGCIGGVRGMPGAYAELAAIDSRLVALAPRSIPLAHAAALPLAGLTAAEGLERSAVGRGNSVLVLGASGGVGHLALHMAKALGASVHEGLSSQAKLRAALASGTHAGFATSQETVGDYAMRVTQGLGFDVLFDCTNGIDLDKLFAATSQGGHVISLVTRRACDLGLLSKKGLSLHAIFIPNPLLTGVGREAFAPRLERIAALVDSGAIPLKVHPEFFTLDRIGEAHALFESSQAEGKIIVLCRSGT